MPKRSFSVPGSFRYTVIRNAVGMKTKRIVAMRPSGPLVPVLGFTSGSPPAYASAGRLCDTCILYVCMYVRGGEKNVSEKEKKNFTEDTPCFISVFITDDDDHDVSVTHSLTHIPKKKNQNIKTTASKQKQKETKTKSKEEERTWNAADATVAATPADFACPEDDDEDAEVRTARTVRVARVASTGMPRAETRAVEARFFITGAMVTVLFCVRE